MESIKSAKNQNSLFLSRRIGSIKGMRCSKEMCGTKRTGIYWKVFLRLNTSQRWVIERSTMRSAMLMGAGMEYGMGNAGATLDSMNGGVPKGSSPTLKPEICDRASWEMSRVVKKVARFYGADLVGSAEFTQLIYSMSLMWSRKRLTRSKFLRLPSCHCHCHWDELRCDRFLSDRCFSRATGLGYSKMAFVVIWWLPSFEALVTCYTAGNDTALSIPLAWLQGWEKAAEWAIGHERFGPRVRLCKVFTDLPLQADSYRSFGVMEFCKTCKNVRCTVPLRLSARNMSTEGPTISNQSGILKWYVDGEKCYSFWAKIGWIVLIVFVSVPSTKFRDEPRCRSVPD